MHVAYFGEQDVVNREHIGDKGHGDTFPETVMPLASAKKTMTQQSSRQSVSCHRTPPISWKPPDMSSM